MTAPKMKKCPCTYKNRSRQCLLCKGYKDRRSREDKR